DPSRARRKVIIRGFKADDEIAAFRTLLGNPALGNNAAPNSTWRGASQWKLQLSLAFWVLRVLRFQGQGVPILDADDSPAILKVQAALDRDPSLRALRAVAAGELDFSQLPSVPLASIRSMFARVLDTADLVLTTSAMSEKMPYVRYKTD